MATRKIKDAKDLSTNELIYFKGHAQATFMSDGQTVEDAINAINSTEGGIAFETDPIFSASPAASITDNKITEWNNKQDTISDLDSIRSGAEKGATALQSVPSEYVTESELTNKGYATTSALNNKVDKVSGKQLSTEDFTTALKSKLEGLNNYDDTELLEALLTLRGDFDKLVSGDTTIAIKTFNEVIAFLDGIQDTQDLSSIIASIEQQIAGKMDKVTLAKVATSGSYNDLSDKPTIPSAVTESTVSGWGFTKNTGQAPYILPFDIDTLDSLSYTDNIGSLQTDAYVFEKVKSALEVGRMIVIRYSSSDAGYHICDATYNGDAISVRVYNGLMLYSFEIYASSQGNILVEQYSLQSELIDGVNIATINGQSLTAGGDLTIESGAKVYEWFYDDEFESVTLSQEEYDNIVEADLVIINTGFLSFTVSKTGKEISEAVGAYSLIGQFEMQESKYTCNIRIDIATKLATFTSEEQNIPTKTSQLENDSNFITSEDVAAVALSGSYNDLQDTPTIPSAVTESTVSGWGFTKNTGTVTGVKINGAAKEPLDGIVDLGSVITEHQDISGKADSSSLSAVATTGDYNDLQNKPVIPTSVSELTNDSNFATESFVTNKIAEAELSEKEVDLSGYATKDDLKTLATKDEIPSLSGYATEIWVGTQGFLTANDIADKQNTITDLETIRSGAALGATALQEVPSEYITEGELNDKGYLTKHQDISHLATKAELPTVPTKVSELDNDSNFITLSDIPEVSVPTKTSELTNDSGFITINDVPVLEIPDEYVTETELNDKGFLTEHQDISHLASRNWVESQGYAHQEDLLEISFNDIQDSPISIDDSGMINFVDESGNVGFQINEEGLRVTDVIAGEHKLSEKANVSDIPSLDEYAKTEDIPSVDGFVKSEDLPNFDEFAKTEDIPSLDDYASKEWVNNKNYATEDDLSNIDYSSIKNVPISEDETGELNIADESGNIGFKINSEGLFAKDVIAGDHVLSNKVDVNNIKTINGQSILGSGNIIVGSGESAIYVLELSGLESGTISQEQYDSVLNATLVNIKFAGVYECISTTKVNTEEGVYLSAQIGESSVTIILSSDLTYTSNQSSNSDWNSEEGDPGYIANRTHYLNGVMKLENSGDTVEVYTSVAGVYMNDYMYPNYRTLKDGESINFGVGCILSRVGDYITLSDPEKFMDRPIYVSHAVEQLSEIFIPDNIARKKGFVELIPVSGSEFRINNMEPNTTYICSESASIINIESFNNEGIVNEYTLHFISSNNPSLNFSNSILWANGIVPELEIDTCYELSIISTKFANNYIYKAVLTPFK